MGLSVYPPIIARQQVRTDVPVATKNSMRCSFLCGPCRIKENVTVTSSQNFQHNLVSFNLFLIIGSC